MITAPIMIIHTHQQQHTRAHTRTHAQYGHLDNPSCSASAGVLYAQLVDRLDSGQLLAECKPPFDPLRCSSYEQLHFAVSRALFKAHVQGALKEEVRPTAGGAR